MKMIVNRHRCCVRWSNGDVTFTKSIRSRADVCTMAEKLKTLPGVRDVVIESFPAIVWRAEAALLGEPAL